MQVQNMDVFFLSCTKIGKELSIVLLSSEDVPAKRVDITDAMAMELKNYLERGDSKEEFDIVSYNNEYSITIKPKQGKLIYVFNETPSIFRRNHSVKPINRYHYINE